MVRFGLWSIILLFGAIQGLVVAAGLLRKRTNKEANWLLSGLVLLLTLKLVPYIIGYAGFYAAYPWLDLAPFELELGIGPLLYLYVTRLTSSSLPKRWQWHLAPLAIQFSLYTVLFLQPMSFKNWFEVHIGSAFGATEGVLVIASLSAYLWLTWGKYFGYERWLRNHFSNPDVHRLRNLRLLLLALSVTLMAFVGAKGWGLLIHSVSYYQMFPFYVLLTVVVYAFGFTAFRFADMQFPTVADQPVPKEVDWRSIANGFTRQLEEQSFWSDPLLSLATAAQALGTSEGQLSRALNSGLGVSFSEWINRYRIEQVKVLLKDPAGAATIQEIWMECGFNSKASFHRWFQAVEGCTPSEFKARVSGLPQPNSGPSPTPHPAP